MNGAQIADAHIVAQTRNKPTKAQKEQRLTFVLNLLAQGCRRGEIKRRFGEEFDCQGRTAETYIRRAREIAREAAGQDRDEMVFEALRFYRAMINDNKISAADRIRARKQLDRLMGLDAPTRVEHSGVGGGPIQTDDGSRAVMEQLMGDSDALEQLNVLADRLDQDDENPQDPPPGSMATP